MKLLIEIIKFIIYSMLIVLVSKYILVVLIRKLAETLNLKPKTIGNISGIATSVPELLSVLFASIVGLVDTSIYNIISSNIINFIQYIFAIILNKNQKCLNNKAIKIDLILVLITICIPLIIVIFNIDANIIFVPIFIMLFIFFFIINKNSHKLYLKEKITEQQKMIQEEERWLKGKKSKTLKYCILLILTSMCLFFIGNFLSNTLEKLSYIFFIPQWIIGISLGFITSLPELITFFEAQKHYQKKNEEEGVIEATNNLLVSNMMNLFFIQSLGIILYTFIK